MSGIKKLVIYRLKEQWAGLLSLIGSIIIVIVGALPSITKGEIKGATLSFFWIGVFFSIFGGILAIVLRPSLQGYKDKIKSLLDEKEDYQEKFQKIINDELYILFKVLGFKDSERINLFKHDGSGQLILIGRRSSNPEFEKKGRSFYPEDKGVLGYSWIQGENIYVFDLPPEEFPYAQACVENWDMQRNVAFDLRMKSRSIGAVVIRNDSSKLAVLVFESTSPNAFKEETIEQLMKYGENKRICLLMKRLDESLPDPTLASAEGF